MNNPSPMAFLPELVLLLGSLALFAVTLGDSKNRLARMVAMATAAGTLLACIAAFNATGTLFSGAYRIDAFSQIVKLITSAGLLLVLGLSRDLPDIRTEIKPEYYLFTILSTLGLLMLASSIDLITLVISLELSSFPLYFLVPMRREREGQRVQMESAIKYIMYGVAANGLMLFGMSYLYGLGGSTFLPVLLAKLQPVINSPLAVAGIALSLCGFYYKLAVFPFHFWTPDVYQGASNETAGLIASLPKVAAVATMARIASLVPAESAAVATLFTVLAVASMFYGNLIALVQTDLKRLLGFSGIAHAGYAMVGFAALGSAGYASAIYYITGYLFMITACFVVISLVSKDGVNVGIEELAGMHRRSPLLALTLGTGVFALAGIPPFVGFMGKLGLLSAALAKGHLALVILAVINSAIAVYYYLGVVRQLYFRDPQPQSETPIPLTIGSRALCIVLLVCIVGLGVFPARVLDFLAGALSCLSYPA